MPKTGRMGLALGFCLIAQGPFFASSALADSAVDLIQDIKAHVQTCGPVGANTQPPNQQCANEQAALVQRQIALHLSNADIGKRMATRGIIGWGPPGIP